MGNGAQVYTHAKELYPAVPRFCLKWNYRVELLLREIEYWNPDILCLQEIDHPLDFENFLKPRGYEGDYAGRTGGRADGCLTCWCAPPLPPIFMSEKMGRLGSRLNTLIPRGEKGGAYV